MYTRNINIYNLNKRCNLKSNNKKDMNASSTNNKKIEFNLTKKSNNNNLIHKYLKKHSFSNKNTNNS